MHFKEFSTFNLLLQISDRLKIMGNSHKCKAQMRVILQQPRYIRIHIRILCENNTIEFFFPKEFQCARKRLNVFGCLAFICLQHQRDGSTDVPIYIHTHTHIVNAMEWMWGWCASTSLNACIFCNRSDHRQKHKDYNERYASAQECCENK